MRTSENIVTLTNIKQMTSNLEWIHLFCVWITTEMSNIAIDNLEDIQKVGGWELLPVPQYSLPADV